MSRAYMRPASPLAEMPPRRFRLRAFLLRLGRRRLFSRRLELAHDGRIELVHLLTRFAVVVFHMELEGEQRAFSAAKILFAQGHRQ